MALRCGQFPLFPPSSLCRLLQTRPAIGPVAKILRDRHDTFGAQITPLEDEAREEYNQLRGWLKAVVPQARTIKSLPKVDRKPGEKAYLASHPEFSRKLKLCAIYLLNHASPPSVKVIKALLEHATEPPLLKICLRILTSMRFQRWPPSAKLGVAFFSALVKACIGTDRLLVSDFKSLLETAFTAESLVPFCVTPATLIEYNKVLSNALPALLAHNLPLAEKQRGIIEALGALGNMCLASDALLIAAQGEIDLMTESFLRVIAAAELFSQPSSSMEREYVVPHSNLAYSEHLLSLVNMLLPRPMKAGSLHAVLCEMHLARGKPLPPSLVLESKPRYLDVYLALSTSLASNDDAGLEEQLHQISPSVSALEGETPDLLQRALEYSKTFRTTLLARAANAPTN